jgi:amino acid transporter
MSGIDYEKNQYAVGESTDHGIKDIVQQKGNNIGEAADIYGDVS